MPAQTQTHYDLDSACGYDPKIGITSTKLYSNRLSVEFLFFSVRSQRHTGKGAAPSRAHRSAITAMSIQGGEQRVKEKTDEEFWQASPRSTGHCGA
jgi:hypothetical protein